MEDILYLTKSEISFDDISRVCNDCGYETAIFRRDVTWLEIRHARNGSEPEGRWVVDRMTADDALDDLEPEELASIQSLACNAYLLIQYRLETLCDLSRLIARLMDSFGGFVYGPDAVIYNRDTILNMRATSAATGDVLVDCGESRLMGTDLA